MTHRGNRAAGTAGGGSFTVTDNDTIDGDEGVDELTNIETILFADTPPSESEAAENLSQSAETFSADTSESLGEGYTTTSVEDAGALGAVESVGV